MQFRRITSFSPQNYPTVVTITPITQMVEVGFETSGQAPQRAVLTTIPCHYVQQELLSLGFYEACMGLGRILSRGQRATLLIFNSNFLSQYRSRSTESLIMGLIVMLTRLSELHNGQRQCLTFLAASKSVLSSMPIANVWRGYWTWASFSCFNRVAATKLESKPPVSETGSTRVTCLVEEEQVGFTILWSPRTRVLPFKIPKFYKLKINFNQRKQSNIYNPR